MIHIISEYYPHSLSNPNENMCEKLTQGIFSFTPGVSAIPFLKRKKSFEKEPSIHLVYLSVMCEEFPQIKGNW